MKNCKNEAPKTSGRLNAEKGDTNADIPFPSLFSRYTYIHGIGVIINPRRACAARVTVVVLCVCVCPGHPSATHATTRPSRHTYGLSIVLAPELIWRFSYIGLVSKIAIALPYSHERTVVGHFYTRNGLIFRIPSVYYARDFTRAVNLYAHV